MLSSPHLLLGYHILDVVTHPTPSVMGKVGARVTGALYRLSNADAQSTIATDIGILVVDAMYSQKEVYIVKVNAF